MHFFKSSGLNSHLPLPAPTPRLPHCSASSLPTPTTAGFALTVTSQPQQSPHPHLLPFPGEGTVSVHGSPPGAPPWGGSSLRGTVWDEALVGAGDRASGPRGLGVAAEGGGGERGSPLGRAWVPGGSSLQAPGGPDHGRLSSSCREDGAGRYQSSSQLSRPVMGRPRGETATRSQDTRAAAASQPPCTLSSRLSCGAECNWHRGTSESATSETRTTSRKPPAPSSRRSRTASRQGPSGSPPDHAASAPETPLPRKWRSRSVSPVHLSRCHPRRCLRVFIDPTLGSVFLFFFFIF